MNILAIGAHFDDVELGCGGSLARHAALGDNVYVFVATESGFANQDGHAERSSEVAMQEADDAMKILGVTELFCGNLKTLEVEFTDSLNIKILKLLNELSIDLVYTHWSGDIHHDHQAVARASLHCCRHVPRLLMYRSNWYNSPLAFHGNFYINISNHWMDKQKAIASYVSEMERTNNKWLSFYHNVAQNAGAVIGVMYAEEFVVLKWLL